MSEGLKSWAEVSRPRFRPAMARSAILRRKICSLEIEAYLEKHIAEPKPLIWSVDMRNSLLPDSDLRPAMANRELAARLTFGNPVLERSINTLETTLRLFVEEFGAPSRAFQIPAEDLQDDSLIVQHKLAITRHLLGIRLGAHLTEIVKSLSNQRTLSVAQSVRAALETAGAATYYEDKFRRTAEDLPGLLRQVDLSLFGQRFEWEVWQAARGKTPRKELETFLSSQRERERKNRPQQAAKRHDVH